LSIGEDVSWRVLWI